MEKVLLLGTVLLAVCSAKPLTAVDEHYLIGLRDLYKVANVNLGETNAPYAVVALDFAGYKHLPEGFQRPNSHGKISGGMELWPCNGDFNWEIDEETNIIATQDFSDGLLSYGALKNKFEELLRQRAGGLGMPTEVHVFFSHLPGLVTFQIASQIAETMPGTTFTVGYYNTAPEVSGIDMTQHLHETAEEIFSDCPNVNFGRIEGKNDKVADRAEPELNACYLNSPIVKRFGWPEPEVFLVKGKSISQDNVKSEFRYKTFNDANYYCQTEGNTQLATVELLERSADNGYRFPCSWQADGVARQVVDSGVGKLEVKVCELQAPKKALVLCSVKKASVQFVERTKTGASDNILGEGNQECMKSLETYLIGINQLEQAVSVGFYNEKCGYTTDGKRYKISRAVGHLKVVECDDDNFGFYCNLEKPEVFRAPTDRDARQTLFETGEAANEECRRQGYHLATLKQLRDAWLQGLDYCDCGHLRCGAIHYPINNPRRGCELSSAGLRPCPADPREIQRTGYAAYCSRAELPIVEQNVETSDWQTASSICKEQGRGLARFEQYATASNLGFRDHRCLLSANGRSYTFDEGVQSCDNPTNFYCTRYHIPVYYVKRNGGQTKFSNVEEAEQACRERGSTLATEDLLELAYQLGYDHCSCGFLRGGKVKYPVNRPRPECGGRPGPGLRDCISSLRTKGLGAFCVAA